MAESIWGKIAALEHELTSSRAHAQALEHELQGLRAAAQHVDHASRLPRWGVDYAFSPHPGAPALRAAHVTLACRYVMAPQGKALTRPEAHVSSAHGIDGASIHEGSGCELAGGYYA